MQADIRAFFQKITVLADKDELGGAGHSDDVASASGVGHGTKADICAF
jgi:hypothetical protein